MASSRPKGIGNPIDLRDIERGLTVQFDERVAYDLESIEQGLKVDVDRQGKLTDISLRKRLAWTIIGLTFCSTSLSLHLFGILLVTTRP